MDERAEPPPGDPAPALSPGLVHAVMRATAG